MVLCLKGVTAFAFDQKFSSAKRLYLERLFTNVTEETLLSDEIGKLNISGVVCGMEGPLTFNIYSSNIANWRDTTRINHLSERLNFFSKADLIADKATLLKVLAMENIWSGDLLTAQQRLSEAAFLYQEAGNLHQVSVVARQLSYINYILGDVNAAIKNSDMALEALKELRDYKTQVKMLLWQSDLFIHDGRFRQAENQLLKKVLVQSYRSKNKLNEWTCYYQLGKLYLNERKYVQSKWFFVQALSLIEHTRHRAEHIRSLLMLAKVKIKVNDYSLALINLKQAEKLSRSYPAFHIDVAREMNFLFTKLNNKLMAREFGRNFEKEKQKYLLSPPKNRV